MSESEIISKCMLEHRVDYKTRCNVLAFKNIIFKEESINFVS